jgi:predicted nucleotidyltransferase
MNAELKNAVDIIVRAVNPDKIILFGSRARGDHKKSSDYDLLVLKEGVPHRREMVWKIEKSLRGTCFDADIIVETPKHFKELVSDPYMVYASINKEGKTIYEK